MAAPIAIAFPQPVKMAAIYTRVSTDEQESNSSLESQRAACQRLADQQGLTVMRVYRDVQSGADLERPQFNAMLTAMGRRELEAVVCLSPDRLSRDMRHQAYVLVTAEKAGVTVHLVQSPPADTLEGRILEVVRGVVAEVERVDIAKRTQSGKRARAAEGAYMPGARPPYGYLFSDPEPASIAAATGQKQRTKTRLIEDVVTGPMVRRIFEHVANGGSARGLATALTNDGIPIPSEYAAGQLAAKSWSMSTLRVILRNPTYKGQAQAYRFKLLRDEAKIVVPLDPITEPMALHGAAVALVSPELWQRANDQLDRNKQESRRHNLDPEATLLRAGYAVCGYCGYGLAVNREKGRAEYRCSQTRKSDRQGHSFNISAKLLDTAVWDRVLDVLTNPDYVRQHMRQWLEGGDTTTNELAHVEAELATIATKEQRLAAQLSLLDDPAPVVRMLNDLSTRKRELVSQCDALRARRQSYVGALEHWENLLARWRRLGFDSHPRIQNMTYAEKRFWLANLNVRAEVWQQGGGPDGERYRITMAIDDGFWLPTEAELTGAGEQDYLDPNTPEGSNPIEFYTGAIVGSGGGRP